MITFKSDPVFDNVIDLVIDDETVGYISRQEWGFDVFRWDCQEIGTARTFEDAYILFGEDFVFGVAA